MAAPAFGSLHPSTRRDASPALAAGREQPSLARQPAHFYCFIELVSAPQRGYELAAHAEKTTQRRSRISQPDATPPAT